MADDRAQGPRGTAGRRPVVIHLVPHHPDDPGQDRRLRHCRRGGGVHVLVDDYAEIWVNGQIPRRLGRPSPATIQGFNMPNRVVLTESVNAGDSFQIAVFGINGPISLTPPNTVWFREAKMEFIR
jgi:hypothetical protein